MIYHIIKVAPSKTLKIHALLNRHGFEVWTPYVLRHQKLTRLDKKKGLQRRSYCHPAFGEFGFMFVGLSDDRQALQLRTIMDKSRHIHDAVLSPVHGVNGPEWYILPQKSLETLQARHKYAYDPLKDNRKGNGRDYQAALEIPEFTVGQIARFIEGGMRGIDFEVWSQFGIEVELRNPKGGVFGKVKASAFDLEGKGA